MGTEYNIVHSCREVMMYLICILLPFLGTTLGAMCSLLIKNEIDKRVERAFTGFAAGAMLYVVVEELIPEMSEGTHSNIGTIAFMVGFCLMMVLDVVLS